jgi:hypothetical protein
MEAIIKAESDRECLTRMYDLRYDSGMEPDHKTPDPDGVLTQQLDRKEIRLAQQCALLDPSEEQALADLGLAEDADLWPPY